MWDVGGRHGIYIFSLFLSIKTKKGQGEFYFPPLSRNECVGWQNDLSYLVFFKERHRFQQDLGCSVSTPNKMSSTIIFPS